MTFLWLGLRVYQQVCFLILYSLKAMMWRIFFSKPPSVILWIKVFLYGDNVFEKDGIRRDRTGDGEKTRCLCGKRGIFNRDGPAMGPQIIRQLE